MKYNKDNLVKDNDFYHVEVDFLTEEIYYDQLSFDLDFNPKFMDNGFNKLIHIYDIYDIYQENDDIEIYFFDLFKEF